MLAKMRSLGVDRDRLNANDWILRRVLEINRIRSSLLLRLKRLGSRREACVRGSVGAIGKMKMKTARKS
jgi:hypothetical protein